MKTKYRSLILFTLAMLLACVAPVMTQRGAHDAAGGPAGGGRTFRPTASLFGKVQSVDMTKQQLTLVLYIHVNDIKAPGVVPPEMAQQATSLLDGATKLERDAAALGDTRPKDRDRKLAEAEKYRKIAEGLLHWRQVQQVITGGQSIPVVGMKRIPISQIPKNTMVRVKVLANSLLAPNTLPARALLYDDVRQVGERILARIENSQPHPLDKSTDMVIVGQVTNIQPLTLTVGDQQIQLDITNTLLQYEYQVPITARDIQPGQRIIVRAQMSGEQQVDALRHVIILLAGAENAMVPNAELTN